MSERALSVFGPFKVIDDAVTAGQVKVSSAIAAAEFAKGTVQISITSGASSTGNSTAKLQASLDGASGWYDVTGATLTISQSEWNTTASYGFSFSDIRAPYVRVVVTPNSNATATNLKAFVWAKGE